MNIIKNDDNDDNNYVNDKTRYKKHVKGKFLNKQSYNLLKNIKKQQKKDKSSAIHESSVTSYSLKAYTGYWSNLT